MNAVEPLVAGYEEASKTFPFRPLFPLKDVKVYCKALPNSMGKVSA